jgi:hypothetical protein
MRIDLEWQDVLVDEGFLFRARKRQEQVESVPPARDWFDLEFRVFKLGLQALHEEIWLDYDLAILREAFGALGDPGAPPPPGTVWDVDNDRGARIRLWVTGPREEDVEEGVELQLWSSGGERHTFLATVLDLPPDRWRAAAAALAACAADTRAA